MADASNAAAGGKPAKVSGKKKSKKTKAGVKGGKGKGASSNLADPRFAHIANDKRFKPLARKDRTLKVDDARFKRMFTDEAFSGGQFMDPRGKPVKVAGSEDVRRLYHTEKGTPCCVLWCVVPSGL